MTTRVTLQAPPTIAIQVTAIDPATGKKGDVATIEPGAHAEAIVHAGQSILIEEVGQVKPTKAKGETKT